MQYFKVSIAGCGKTLIAKATAKEAGMRFINLDVAMLTDKWYGESQKLASAVFTLAIKLQPCIIFIDEIDSFLRSRNTNDHEATAMMKVLFSCSDRLAHFRIISAIPFFFHSDPVYDAMGRFMY